MKKIKRRKYPKYNFGIVNTNPKVEEGILYSDDPREITTINEQKDAIRGDLVKTHSSIGGGIGSIWGPIGTAIGSGVGALGGLMHTEMKGNKFKPIHNYDRSREYITDSYGGYYTDEQAVNQGQIAFKLGGKSYPKYNFGISNQFDNLGNGNFEVNQGGRGNDNVPLPNAQNPVGLVSENESVKVNQDGSFSIGSDHITLKGEILKSNKGKKDTTIADVQNAVRKNNAILQKRSERHGVLNDFISKNTQNINEITDQRALQLQESVKKSYMERKNRSLAKAKYGMMNLPKYNDGVANALGVLSPAIMQGIFSYSANRKEKNLIPEEALRVKGERVQSSLDASKFNQNIKGRQYDPTAELNTMKAMFNTARGQQGRSFSANRANTNSLYASLQKGISDIGSKAQNIDNQIALQTQMFNAKTQMTGEQLRAQMSLQAALSNQNINFKEQLQNNQYNQDLTTLQLLGVESRFKRNTGITNALTQSLKDYLTINALDAENPNYGFNLLKGYYKK